MANTLWCPNQAERKSKEEGLSANKVMGTVFWDARISSEYLFIESVQRRFEKKLIVLGLKDSSPLRRQYKGRYSQI